MLLQQRHQEVDGQVDILNQLILSHVYVADGDVKAQHLKREVIVHQTPWYESNDLGITLTASFDNCLATAVFAGSRQGKSDREMFMVEKQSEHTKIIEM